MATVYQNTNEREQIIFGEIFSNNIPLQDLIFVLVFNQQYLYKIGLWKVTKFRHKQTLSCLHEKLPYSKNGFTSGLSLHLVAHLQCLRAGRPIPETHTCIYLHYHRENLNPNVHSKCLVKHANCRGKWRIDIFCRTCPSNVAGYIRKMIGSFRRLQHLCYRMIDIG